MVALDRAIEVAPSRHDLHFSAAAFAPDPAHDWLRRAVERLESGQADAGFLVLQRLIATRRANPALAEERFQALLDRLEALQR